MNGQGRNFFQNNFDSKISEYAFDAQACHFKKKKTMMTSEKMKRAQKFKVSRICTILKLLKTFQKFEQLNVHKVHSWIRDDYSFLMNNNWRKVNKYYLNGHCNQCHVTVWWFLFSVTLLRWIHQTVRCKMKKVEHF